VLPGPILLILGSTARRPKRQEPANLAANFAGPWRLGQQATELDIKRIGPGGINHVLESPKTDVVSKTLAAKLAAKYARNTAQMS